MKRCQASPGRSASHLRAPRPVDCSDLLCSNRHYLVWPARDMYGTNSLCDAAESFQAVRSVQQAWRCKSRAEVAAHADVIIGLGRAIKVHLAIGTSQSWNGKAASWTHIQR